MLVEAELVIETRVGVLQADNGKQLGMCDVLCILISITVIILINKRVKKCKLVCVLFDARTLSHRRK